MRDTYVSDRGVYLTPSDVPVEGMHLPARHGAYGRDEYGRIVVLKLCDCSNPRCVNQHVYVHDEIVELLMEQDAPSPYFVRLGVEEVHHMSHQIRVEILGSEAELKAEEDQLRARLDAEDDPLADFLAAIVENATPDNHSFPNGIGIRIPGFRIAFIRSQGAQFGDDTSDIAQ